MNATKEKKRPNMWTREEHERFIEGLNRCGKGNWKQIAVEHVYTRTATQVASHAQKYFERLQTKDMKNRRRRHSVFDTVRVSSDEETGRVCMSSDSEESPAPPNFSKPDETQRSLHRHIYNSFFVKNIANLMILHSRLQPGIRYPIATKGGVDLNILL
jgi:SHAQKYF class myb-like DNA-binding protein